MLVLAEWTTRTGTFCHLGGNFDGINLDIMSDGQYISKGAQVEIIKVKDNKLVVAEK